MADRAHLEQLSRELTDRNERAMLMASDAPMFDDVKARLMSQDLATATFEQLAAIHAVIGDEVPCEWPAYREAMIGFYKVDGRMLDTLYRLGHLRAGETGVRFSGLNF